MILNPTETESNGNNASQSVERCYAVQKEFGVSLSHCWEEMNHESSVSLMFRKERSSKNVVLCIMTMTMMMMMFGRTLVWVHN